MSTTTADWYPDPWGRHELRYHDGTQWTAHVSSHGTTSIDEVTDQDVKTVVGTHRPEKVSKQVDRAISDAERRGAPSTAQPAGWGPGLSTSLLDHRTNLLINAVVEVHTRQKRAHYCNGERPGDKKPADVNNSRNNGLASLPIDLSRPTGVRRKKPMRKGSRSQHDHQQHRRLPVADRTDKHHVQDSEIQRWDSKPYPQSIAQRHLPEAPKGGKQN